jgi:hypothetical protein
MQLGGRLWLTVPRNVVCNIKALAALAAAAGEKFRLFVTDIVPGSCFYVALHNIDFERCFEQH